MRTSYLILGLGNPGSKYARTRHNVGFLSLNLAAVNANIRMKRPFFSSYKIGLGDIAGTSCLLVKPLTYMNRSGIILPRLMEKHQLTAESLVVFCDNMDLPPGTVRVRRGGGTAGHRGLSSIQHEIHGSEFIRVYIGIGRPAPGAAVVDHVLGIPGTEEASRILFGVRRAQEAAFALMKEPLERVMNEYNRKNAHISDNQ